MGFRMAKNLRTKLPAEEKLVIYDVDTKAVETFAQEAGPNTHIAKDAREVAEKSVCVLQPSLAFPLHPT
jgi:6-phosphogluconate dehydrogenase (decarboxylating)